MRDQEHETPAVRTAVLAVAVFLASVLSAGPAMSAGGIDPDADQILRAMASYLGGMKVFSVNADIDNEVITTDGEKLQFSSFSTIVMERPAKFVVKRKGMFSDAEFDFDGKTLTLYGKNLNVYIQTEVSGTIDDAIRAVESETGLDAPGADLLFAEPYPILASGVVRGAYIGTAYVDGVECHHLALREDKVDWQLWVKTGDEPLPMKYVITTKWMTGAPQYTVRLWDWNRDPHLKAEQFMFKVPGGARKLDRIPVNEMGEFVAQEEDNSR